MTAVLIWKQCVCIILSLCVLTVLVDASGVPVAFLEKTCCDTFPWLPGELLSLTIITHTVCTYSTVHLHTFIYTFFPSFTGTHTETNLDWISLKDDWCDMRQRLLFPCLVLSHLFPLYRPAALCWYRADIWTGVTWVICSHGLQQWLAKTGQLSSG